MTLAPALDTCDTMRPTVSDESIRIYKSAPGRIGRNLVLGSQDATYKELDNNRVDGCIRDIAHAYSQEGGWVCLCR